MPVVGFWFGARLLENDPKILKRPVFHQVGRCPPLVIFAQKITKRRESSRITRTDTTFLLLIAVDAPRRARGRGTVTCCSSRFF